MKNFKITQLQGNFFVYPSPVIKNQKYLIMANHLFQANILKIAFELEILNLNHCQPNGIHSDGATPLYQLNTQLPSIELLTRRENDIARAEQLETILWKHLVNLYLSLPEDRAQMQKKLYQAYTNQTSCSSCQALGIESEQLASFIDKICFN